MQRLSILKDAHDNDELKKSVIHFCTNDIVFFCDGFCYTLDDRKDSFYEKHVPFLLYPFQEEFLKNIVNNISNSNDAIVHKSRDMGLSWMMVVLCVWCFLFKGYSSLYGAYKEEYVDKRGSTDSFFGRVRYVLDRLPPWMKPQDIRMSDKICFSDSLSCEIRGDVGKNFGVGSRKKLVIMDEFALWEYDQTAFLQTRDIVAPSGTRIIISTPRGKSNVYGRIFTGHKDFKDIQINKYSLLWHIHPNKTKEWYEEEKKRRTKVELAQEVDASFDASFYGAVYPEFTKVSFFGNYQYDPSLPLYTSWDFGRDMTAIIWVQHDFKNDVFYLIDAFQKSQEDYVNGTLTIDFFTAFITGNEKHGFRYTNEEREMIERHNVWVNNYAEHFGDPYNSDSKQIQTTSSIADVLRNYGIHIKTNRNSTLEERIRKTSLFFPKLFVNENLYSFIQSIEQSQYPQKRENSQSTTENTKPIHNIFSHYRTCLEYFVDNAPKKTAHHDAVQSIKTRDIENIKKFVSSVY